MPSVFLLAALAVSVGTAPHAPPAASAAPCQPDPQTTSAPHLPLSGTADDAAKAALEDSMKAAAEIRRRERTNTPPSL